MHYAYIRIYIIDIQNLFLSLSYLIYWEFCYNMNNNQNNFYSIYFIIWIIIKITFGMTKERFPSIVPNADSSPWPQWLIPGPWQSESQPRRPERVVVTRVGHLGSWVAHWNIGWKLAGARPQAPSNAQISIWQGFTSCMLFASRVQVVRVFH
jgi:hypothetical protein